MTHEPSTRTDPEASFVRPPGRRPGAREDGRIDRYRAVRTDDWLLVHAPADPAEWIRSDLAVDLSEVP